jgi:hypothetical protein
VFAGACRFDRGVEREQIRLIRDLVDRLRDVADPLGRAVQCFDAFERRRRRPTRRNARARIACAMSPRSTERASSSSAAAVSRTFASRWSAASSVERSSSSTLAEVARAVARFVTRRTCRPSRRKRMPLET